MRRTLLLGLAGAALAPSAAFAQFAAERPAPAVQPPGTLPSFPTGPSAPPPARTNAIAPAVQTNPWAAKVEHGPWMLCIKSYSGKGSEQLAVELATEIRTQFKAAAYVYEWGAEDRAREMARQEDYRRQIKKEYEPFLALQNDLRAKAAAQGTEFIETPVKYKLPTIDYTTQWGVFVGGFKDMDTARKALDVVRLWSPPKAQHLMDRAVMANDVKGETVNKEHAFLNPYATAMVVPNPAVRSDPNAKQAVDPALAMFNKEEPLSLLKTRKKYTLMVKGFTIPTTVQPRDQDGGVMGKIFGSNDAEAILNATAKQARELATYLRDKLQYDAYVLHTRTGSLVTVGQYDSIEDGELQTAMRKLIWLTFEVHEKDPVTGKKGRFLENRRMFDAVLPMEVPR